MSAMPVHMTHSSDITEQNKEPNKGLKAGTFHEAFCKTGIDPEGLTRITL